MYDKKKKEKGWMGVLVSNTGALVICAVSFPTHRGQRGRGVGRGSRGRCAQWYLSRLQRRGASALGSLMGHAGGHAKVIGRVRRAHAHKGGGECESASSCVQGRHGTYH